MISDFGLSKITEEDEADQLGTACGTPGYVGRLCVCVCVCVGAICKSVDISYVLAVWGMFVCVHNVCIETKH